MKNPKKIAVWAFQILAALILLQTLYFKFTGAAESIYIFKTLGVEPYGRIGSGIIELVASILLLTNRYAWAGALIGFGVMAGAIFSHLTKLGIEIMNDGGYLFSLGVITFICCASVLFIRRIQIPYLNL